MATIRAYAPTDRDAVYDICVRTAERGGDARGLYCSDDLMPDVFAGPYVHLEPELAFVLDDGTRPVGYVIGTSDTVRFVRRYREEWMPLLDGKYAVPPDPTTTRDELIRSLHFQPEHMLEPELADFPAHLHIDLLPEWQGRGFGRALMLRLLATLASQGVQAVHLDMDPANTGARAFYDKLGFRQLVVSDPDATVLVRATA